MLGDYFTVCKCACHKYPDRVKHIISCCYTCNICHKHIKNTYYKSHVKDCEENKQNFFQKYYESLENNGNK